MVQLNFWDCRLCIFLAVFHFNSLSCSFTDDIIDVAMPFQILLQIDAAINSGNSGGPAFNDKGKCVGIAFQSLKHEDVENIGYVIPTPVIQHFIHDYEKNGAYTGTNLLITFLSK